MVFILDFKGEYMDHIKYKSVCDKRVLCKSRLKLNKFQELIDFGSSYYINSYFKDSLDRACKKADANIIVCEHYNDDGVFVKNG